MEINVQKFNRIEKGILAPVYPVIAGQILERTGITKGTCLDIGCGGGSLGMALAGMSELFVHFFDKSEDMLSLVDEAMNGSDPQIRYNTIQGDVVSIELPDESVNLAVSRGSIFFWEDLPRAFREIYRVLAPGGWAYIGGGFGSKELKESILNEMKSREKAGEEAFHERIRNNLGDETHTRFETAVKTAGIDKFFILHGDDIGLWVIIRK